LTKERERERKREREKERFNQTHTSTITDSMHCSTVYKPSILTEWAISCDNLGGGGTAIGEGVWWP